MEAKKRVFFFKQEVWKYRRRATHELTHYVIFFIYFQQALEYIFVQDMNELVDCIFVDVWYTGRERERRRREKRDSPTFTCFTSV